MSEFDDQAASWDAHPSRLERSEAVAAAIRERVPLKKAMAALEYGAGTGLLGLRLAGSFWKLVLMDSSPEMVRVMQEKVVALHLDHVFPACVNLEEGDYDGRFDFIFNQMVMHHIRDVDFLLKKFCDMLNPGGWLAIADLYAEDGSFHGEGFTGHHGFDVDELAARVGMAGFGSVESRPCYVRKKMVKDQMREYPLFLMTAVKLRRPGQGVR